MEYARHRNLKRGFESGAAAHTLGMNQLRTPQGQPTGGEFASHDRAEAEVALVDSRPFRTAYECAGVDVDYAKKRMMGLAVRAVGEAGRDLAPGAQKVRLVPTVSADGDYLSFGGVTDGDNEDVAIDTNHSDWLGDEIDDIGLLMTGSEDFESYGLEWDGENNVYYAAIPAGTGRPQSEIDEELALLDKATEQLAARRAEVAAAGSTTE